MLDGNDNEPHNANLVTFWTELRDNIDEIEIEDPANPTGNDLSEFFGDEEREQLSATATLTMGLADAGDWEGIFGPIDPEEEGEEQAEMVALGSWSHRAAPEWEVRPTPFLVSVTCAYQTRRGRWSREWKSGEAFVTDKTWFRYRATTDVPEPYEVRWQVVNTGAHATEKDCLRGGKFFSAKGKDRKPSADPLETWESAEYTGKHWIECFILKEGEIWARSGPFYVGIVNRQRRGIRWFRPRRRRRRGGRK